MLGAAQGQVKLGQLGSGRDDTGSPGCKSHFHCRASYRGCRNSLRHQRGAVAINSPVLANGPLGLKPIAECLKPTHRTHRKKTRCMRHPRSWVGAL